jgi:hypothetical protein
MVVAQAIGHLTADYEIEGSNPGAARKLQKERKQIFKCPV